MIYRVFFSPVETLPPATAQAIFRYNHYRSRNRHHCHCLCSRNLNPSYHCHCHCRCRKFHCHSIHYHQHCLCHSPYPDSSLHHYTPRESVCMYACVCACGGREWGHGGRKEHNLHLLDNMNQARISGKFETYQGRGSRAACSKVE